VAQYYFRFRIWWCQSHPKVKIYPQTKFRRCILIHGWYITTSVLEKQPAAILELYFRFRFRPYHPIDMSFCNNLAKFRPHGTSHGRKMTSCQFSRWQIAAILNFRGPIMNSLKSLCRTSYRSSIDTIALNCLVFFIENRVFALRIWRQTDRRTNGHTDGEHQRCRERWLSNVMCVQPQGFMETGVRYTEVTSIVTLSPWDAGHKHCIQLMFADGNSLLLQVSGQFRMVPLSL